MADETTTKKKKEKRNDGSEVSARERSGIQDSQRNADLVGRYVVAGETETH